MGFPNMSMKFSHGCSGSCVGTIAEPFMETAAFDGIHDALEVPFAALIGILIYVCASGATPLGAVLLHKAVCPQVLLSRS